jgi:Common central domain of tyrosinase
MSGGFSPNDPIFFLHHANVDRLWARWQTQRLAAVPGSTPENHYPPPTQLSPFDGDPAPLGHRLNDAMWPWIGTTPGFDADVDTAVRQLLPDFTDRPPNHRQGRPGHRNHRRGRLPLRRPRQRLNSGLGDPVGEPIDALGGLLLRMRARRPIRLHRHQSHRWVHPYRTARCQR